MTGGIEDQGSVVHVIKGVKGGIEDQGSEIHVIKGVTGGSEVSLTQLVHYKQQKQRGPVLGLHSPTRITPAR